ncbi:Fe(3+) dicitrate ABC transporter substrate-binding protein [Psittacicella hinzii]|uniref:Fe/B12 periplasmic-binding domain-containing protein n=1 Tax=Psittacicella hinzii TaxID=2028575 RepID=A0A3A1YQ92_9GAMM|nr:Fe(3+) dicitrate ABC transporter substrate-binding protein [Psittacicella hinzii]RIY39378.1 hypothetical protein CKF58_02245 [Psittacicella hinzii]
MFKRLLCSFMLILSCFNFNAYAQVTVKDATGKNFTYNQAAKRVVVLEFSFADALANVDVKAVGIADDGDAKRLIPIVAQKQAGYQSVGMRAQPNLEVIAALKPDLIIADVNRHSSIYAQLQSIAPTILLNSLYETYDEDLANAKTIAALVGKSEAFAKRFATYQQQMQELAKKANAKGKLAAFCTSRENQFEVYTANTYQGGILQALGFKLLPTPANSSNGRINSSLEQVLTTKVETLFIANYVENSISRQWESNPLWQAIPAVKNNAVYAVDTNLWARARGMYASLEMAQQVVDSIK